MKLKALAASVLLTMAGGANAAQIGLGTDVTPGGLFISVFNTVSQQTYFANLGVDLVTIANGGSLGPVTLPGFAAFAGSDPLSYNIAASWAPDSVNLTNIDADGNAEFGVPAAGANVWGILTTAQSATNFDADQNGNGFNSIAADTGSIKNYVANLNVLLESADQAIVGNGTPQSWNDGNWGANSALSVLTNGQTAFSQDDLAPLFFVTNDFVNGFVKKTGDFVLSANGTLTYTPAGVSTVPVPGAVWLLGSALVGFSTIARRNSKA